MQVSSPEEAEQEDAVPSPPNKGAAGAQPPVRDADSVMVCLKRALKIAHAAQQQLAVARKTTDTTPVHLFVHILNHYVYFFEQGLPLVTVAVLQVSPFPRCPIPIFAVGNDQNTCLQ